MLTPNPKKENSPLIRAIVFDFDGVIADTEDLHFKTFAATLREEGLEITREENDRKFLGLSDLCCFEKALEEAGRSFTAEYRDRLVEKKTALYQAGIERIELCTGASELIRAAAERFPLAISSSGRRAEIDMVLRRHGLGAYFAVLVSADDNLASKPDPGSYRKAQALLQSHGVSLLSSRACLVIEDSPRGIEAAKRAGMRCIAVTHTFSEHELHAADRIVDSLLEIPSEWADLRTV